jgi:hypothetical protein
LENLEGANKDANPELMRLAMKMATGSGKTTVMAMLIGWQTVNAVRSKNSSLLSRGFLIMAPGITIRDRRRVLLPQFDHVEATWKEMTSRLVDLVIEYDDMRPQLWRLTQEGLRLSLCTFETDETVGFEDLLVKRALLTPELVGPCKTLLAGIVGEDVEIGPDVMQGMLRPSEISFHLAKHLLYFRFREPGQPAPMHLFGQIKGVVRRWLDGGYLQCTGGTFPAMVAYPEIAEKAAELIHLACQRNEGGTSRMKAMVEAYNPRGSTTHVNFATTKETFWKTAADKSHVNYVVCDSDWEAELARVVESHLA